MEDRLRSCYRGFREEILDFAALTDQLQAWVEAFPEVVRLQQLGLSPEGRPLWLLTVGAEPDRVRPAAWVNANQHAGELAGSSVALAIAEDALRLALGMTPHELSPQAHEVLADVLFYIMPRVSPDGAEAVLKTGRYVRSVPRESRVERPRARWLPEDLDGDGLALLMRKEDPTGEFVACPDFPGLLVPRTVDDQGPFYKVWPEGRIEGFDGDRVPDPYFLSDNEPDLNRNFPATWAPEPEQAGAGRFPGSEPESQAIIAFGTAHPNIFLWLDVHTFGGVFIRPHGALPDHRMDPQDLALFKEIGEEAEALTGYPMVSGFEEFTYEPEKPLHGDMVDWAYLHRGCVAYVCELWDLFARLELPRPKRFVEYYTSLQRDDLVRLARWDAEQNQGRVIRPWRKLAHPQLGEVEVGGLDPRFGLWNPPPEALPRVCREQSAHFLRTAARAPRLALTDLQAEALGPGAWRVHATVLNQGYLPSYVLSSARRLPWNEPVWAEIVPGEGMAVDGAPLQEVGHLDGWGRGRGDAGSALYFQRSRGSTGRGRVSWLVRGQGRLEVRAGSCRLGVVRASLELAATTTTTK